MSADEAYELSNLIGDIYDAALEPDLWPAALEKVSAFVGCDTAVLAHRDLSNRATDFTYFCNSDHETRKAYDSTYIKLDPTYIGFNLTPIGEPVSTTDCIPLEDFLQTRFYKEFAAPRDWVDSCGLVLDRSAASATVLCMIRTRKSGFVDDALRRRARLVAPHLRRSALIGAQLAQQTRKADTLDAAFDSLAAGVFLIESSGRIAHMNSAGIALVDRGDLLQVIGGRLMACDRSSNINLHQLLSTIDKGDAAADVQGVAMPLSTLSGERFAVHMLPLASKSRRRVAGGQADAVIFVTKASIDALSPPRIIANAYRLTPTELRVLLAIVEVGGVPEVAATLGVAEGTVKSHLKGVYAKTGATRQADLVKLVAGYANPLVG